MADAALPLKWVTIGVYGFTERAFFAALRGAGVDTFCDIRYRRGVRGADYAFANRTRLQKRLEGLGIRYLHFRELAPNPTLRRLQYAADKAAGAAKRKRTVLSEGFIAGYQDECLATFSSREFTEQLGAKAGTIALFCVETEPAACHRSLLAERLQRDLGAPVVHLLPKRGDS